MGSSHGHRVSLLNQFDVVTADSRTLCSSIVSCVADEPGGTPTAIPISGRCGSRFISTSEWTQLPQPPNECKPDRAGRVLHALPGVPVGASLPNAAAGAGECPGAPLPGPKPTNWRPGAGRLPLPSWPMKSPREAILVEDDPIRTGTFLTRLDNPIRIVDA